MRNKYTILFVSIAVFVFFSTVYAQKKEREKGQAINIGIVIDGAWGPSLEIAQLFQREIMELTKGEFNIRFPENMRLIADHTPEGAKAAVDRLITDDDVDFILTVGPISSHDIATRSNLRKPVIAPFIINPQLQGLSIDENGSGIDNLSYITYPADFQRDITTFREIVPFDKLAILVSRGVIDAIPELITNAENQLQSLGLEVNIVPVDTSVTSALAAIPENTEAVYIAPLRRISADDFKRLANGLIQQKLPSFSFFGRSEVEAGVLMTLSPTFNFERLARRVGLYVQRILLGEDASELPVTLKRQEQLVVNMETARRIHTFPTWEAVTDAELLHEERTDIKRKLTLESAIKEAIVKNLDLSAAKKEVAAGKQNIAIARSSLLPQASASALGTLIDKDRAEASFGSQAERTVSGSLTLSQLLYSEPAWANLSIQKHLQNSLEQEREQLRLDIARDAAITYLNILRAKTFQRIQKNNLEVSRSNLELSQIRESIGQGSRAEVFRWESEIALDKIDVINADAQLYQIRIALNQILHHPQEELFLTAEAGLDDPVLLTSDPRLLTYTQNVRYFAVFRDFMTDEGLKASPELRQIDVAISAQTRAYTSAKRAFWSPTIALQGDMTNTFSKDGAGSESSDTSVFNIPSRNDLDWSVVLNFSIPIFNGAQRFATRTQARETLSQLLIQRQAIAERIEQRIRSALHDAGSSHPAIRLSRQASNAANQNLELVIDAYSRGVVDIIQLLDAQNAALTADLGAENAIYDFLIDFMEIQRAIGNFDIFMSLEEREAWFKRLDIFFEKMGVSPKSR